MSTPVIPDGGGFVVISQVRPQNDEGNGPGEGQSGNAPASLPKPVVQFYKGEPEVLGTVQIFAGILLISIGIPMTIVGWGSHVITLLMVSAIPLWSGILYIIAGSLSVAASVKPTTERVRVNLGMNIFNTLASSCGIILAAIDFILPLRYLGSQLGSFCAHYKSDIQCLGDFNPLPVYISIEIFLLMLFMLMFCISISASVFACRTVCRSSFDEMHVVIYQTTSLIVSDTTKNVHPESTAALTSDL